MIGPPKALDLLLEKDTDQKEILSQNFGGRSFPRGTSVFIKNHSSGSGSCLNHQVFWDWLRKVEVIWRGGFSLSQFKSELKLKWPCQPLEIHLRKINSRI